MFPPLAVKVPVDVPLRATVPLAPSEKLSTKVLEVFTDVIVISPAETAWPLWTDLSLQ